MTVTNTVSGTNVHEVADGIYRISTPVVFDGGPGGFSFNQYLIVDDEPLLFHTGPRRMFGLVHEALASVLPPERLRHIAFSHVEADECGSLNEWLAVAPHALRRDRRHRDRHRDARLAAERARHAGRHRRDRLHAADRPPADDQRRALSQPAGVVEVDPDPDVAAPLEPRRDEDREHDPGDEHEQRDRAHPARQPLVVRQERPGHSLTPSRTASTDSA